MVKRQGLYRISIMKEKSFLQHILIAGLIESEIELERALVLYNKLRLLSKDDKSLVSTKNELRKLILQYEKLNWNKGVKISTKKVQENNNAVKIAEQERVFLEKRKEILKSILNKYKLSQQDFGVLLGHSKTYISELVNGLTPFSNKDIVLIHNLFGIKLELLISTNINLSDKIRLKEKISLINNPRLNKVYSTKIGA